MAALKTLTKADALALTFAYPVARSDHYGEMTRGRAHEFDYDPSGWGK